MAPRGERPRFGGPERALCKKITLLQKSLATGLRALIYHVHSFFGGIAQLVERLNGIQKARSSTLLTSTIKEGKSKKKAG